MRKPKNEACPQCGTSLRLFGIERHAIIDRMALRTFVCPACDTVETELVAMRPAKPLSRATESSPTNLLGYCGYDDEATRMLCATFDSAWAKLKASGGPLTDGPLADTTRELLARCIIALGRRATASDEKLDEKALLFLAFLTQGTGPGAPSRRLS